MKSRTTSFVPEDWILVFPAEDGSLPRESELGLEFFFRYIHLLSEGTDEALRLFRVPRSVRSRSRKGTRYRHPWWSQRHRRAMHSLSNWAEFRPFQTAPLTKEPVREQEVLVTAPPVRETSRHKSRVLAFYTLGNTSLDATSRLRVWTPRNEGDQPPFVVTEVEDWIDYQVGLGRPFRPVSGSKGNAKVPSTCGTGLKVVLGYDPLPGKFPAAYKWYENMPAPRIFSEVPWQRFGLPVDEQTVAPSTGELQARRDEALASMYAGTPKSRPNFLRALLELKDLRASARGLADFFSWSRKTMQRWINRPLWRLSEGGGGGAVGAVMSGRESIRQMASLYLNAQFGIIPTASDVKLFLDKLREGLKVFAEDQGSPFKEGAVVTSHYRVVPREVANLGKPRLIREISKTPQVAWYNSDWAKVSQTTAVSLNAGELSQKAREWKVIRATVIDGTVFARLKLGDEVSEYFKRQYGHVGYTWSYPGITTAWELLPWSWLVDWFTDARRSIRAAERLARSYWMRVGFQEPWYFEKLTYQRYYPNFRFRVVSVRGPSRCRFYGGGSPMRATMDLRVLAYAFYGSGYASRASYSRGPLEYRPDAPIQRTQCKVNVFRISIGMALIAQAATGSRRFRSWLDEQSHRVREPHVSGRLLRQVRRKLKVERRELRHNEIVRRQAAERARDEAYWASFQDTL